MSKPYTKGLFSRKNGYSSLEHSVIEKAVSIFSSNNPPTYQAALLAPDAKPIEHNPPPSYVNAMKPN